MESHVEISGEYGSCWAQETRKQKNKVCLNLFSTLLDILIETQDEEEEDDKNHKIFISDISLLIDEL